MRRKEKSRHKTPQKTDNNMLHFILFFCLQGSKMQYQLDENHPFLGPLFFIFFIFFWDSRVYSLRLAKSYWNNRRTILDIFFFS
ncbi:hypothetical protein BDF20DRAFT_878048 [Mycotypha africana]|uniref:uncharacterized protein n=1 Tax=Mycotypha africana TaxID=64632 RepID=UPI00230105AD|nr:uncharacterized protein BDF20DRAFT_878048 [Mycotypha africana]KAI8975338.1 hypothetical protein BDF20DRAFT_878048 [Mycotypha africana]